MHMVQLGSNQEQESSTAKIGRRCSWYPIKSRKQNAWEKNHLVRLQNNIGRRQVELLMFRVTAILLPERNAFWCDLRGNIIFLVVVIPSPMISHGWRGSAAELKSEVVSPMIFTGFQIQLISIKRHQFGQKHKSYGKKIKRPDNVLIKLEIEYRLRRLVE